MKRRERAARLQHLYGRPPAEAESGQMLLDALERQEPDADACVLRPGAWQPAPDPLLETQVQPQRATDIGTAREPAFDEDLIMLQIEAFASREGLVGWMEHSIRRAEQIAEEEELEALIAAEAEAETEETGEPEAEPAAGTEAVEDARRMRDVLTGADYMAEWEQCEPLARGISHLALRQLAGLAHVGSLVLDLARGRPILDVFDRRHEQMGELIRQLDQDLAAKHVPPDELVVEALNARISQALDRILTAEVLRIPQDIRRIVVQFRRVRESRSAQMRALQEAGASLVSIHLALDACETAIRASGAHPSVRDIRQFGELLAACEGSFQELARLESEMASGEDELERHRGVFLTLCERAREAVTAVEQVRAAAQMLTIRLSESVSDQMREATARLTDAVDTYSDELNLSFGIPERAASVRRLETELADRKRFFTSLMRPRAKSVFTTPPNDRNEEIRRLVLLTYATVCQWRTVRGRGTNAVIMSVMVRAGLIVADEAEHAKSLMLSREATEWRKTHFVHTPMGTRGHLYCPTAGGYELAKSYTEDLVDAGVFEAVVHQALKDHDRDFFAAKAAKAEAEKKANQS